MLSLRYPGRLLHMSYWAAQFYVTTHDPKEYPGRDYLLNQNWGLVRKEEKEKSIGWEKNKVVIEDNF